MLMKLTPGRLLREEKLENVSRFIKQPKIVDLKTLYITLRKIRVPRTKLLQLNYFKQPE